MPTSSFATTFLKKNTRTNDRDLRTANDYIIPFARIDAFKRLPMSSLPNTWKNEFGDLGFGITKYITFKA